MKWKGRGGVVFETLQIFRQKQRSFCSYYNKPPSISWFLRAVVVVVYRLELFMHTKVLRARTTCAYIGMTMNEREKIALCYQLFVYSFAHKCCLAKIEQREREATHGYLNDEKSIQTMQNVSVQWKGVSERKLIYALSS